MALNWEKVRVGSRVLYGDNEVTVIARAKPTEDFLGETEQFRIQFDDGEEWIADYYELELA